MALHVKQTGTPERPSIVFLHGIGTSGWMWEKQVAAFPDFHCLIVDLPGHGRSNHAPWESLANTADEIAALIQMRATNGRAHVVGLSLGGYVGLVLLERHEKVVERAVVSGVTAAPMPNRSLLPVQLWLTSAFMKRRWVLNAQARSLNVPPEMKSAFIEGVQAMSMEAYRRIWEEAAEFELPAALRHVSTPTLIVAGGRESKVILDAVDEIPKLMPRAEGRLAPGFGHGWNIEAPELFSAMVRAWITGTPLPTALQSTRRSDISA
ncbi:MAG: alpha/beta hydrolase [Chloroflexi bacterium]|nr:alpha/beta hydrolase [Chloroflexota bacterium]